MKKLILFDIDGTLVNINKLYINSYKAAYKKVYGINVSSKTIINGFGMAEKEAHKEVLTDAGIFDLSKVNEVIANHVLNMKEKIEKTKIVPLKGVIDFLEYLKSNEDYIVGIISGNLEEIGLSILKNAGIYHYFSVFSLDDGRKRGRKGILRFAIATAKKKYSFSKIIVIGDTPKDIRVGKEIGIFTVGVATGSHKIGALKIENPDLVVPNLRNYRHILEALD